MSAEKMMPDSNGSGSNLTQRVVALESAFSFGVLDLYRKIVELNEQVESLEARIAERAGVSKEQRVVEEACMRLKISQYHFLRTQANYYSLSLSERAAVLRAPGEDHLCKSLIYRNTNWDSTVKGHQNSEYYCIVLQYTHMLDNDRLNALIKMLNRKNDISRSFSFRFATEEESLDISGFKHNAIAPIGMKKQIPIIVSSSIMNLVPPIIYLGGGLVDLKLKLANIHDFATKTKALILNISTPR
mmetsp:Transcript_14980/g.19677  ORF Transcript_14980/g.19677 Transcript_14980/m.19677 type:complete len:244 (+) Transcript_14980:654-1385(+)